MYLVFPMGIREPWAAINDQRVIMAFLSHKSLGRENIWFHITQGVVQSYVEI